MQIQIRTLRRAEPELDRWVESLPGNEPERRSFAQFHLALVYDWIVTHQGKPPGARQVDGIEPSLYWWEFFLGWWMRFAVRTRTRWWVFHEHDIVIIAVQDSQPDFESPEM